MNRLAVLPVLFLVSTFATAAEQAGKGIAMACSILELRDQYDCPQALSFPSTNVTFLTIADKKGSSQVDAWIAAIKPRYAGRIDIRGLADVAGVPSFLRGKVRRKFQETRKYPVMLDWSGQVCAQFGPSPEQANVLVIDRGGHIAGRFRGEASETNLTAAFNVLDNAILMPSSLPVSEKTK